VVVAVLLAAMCGGLLWYALRPDWRTLYVELDPEDARQTEQILSQAQIVFEPTADGAGIRVPAAQLDKARLATAAKGGVKSGRLGFEIFDKPNWVGSEFDEQVTCSRRHSIAVLPSSVILSIEVLRSAALFSIEARIWVRSSRLAIAVSRAVTSLIWPAQR
jgi:flagellar M-ring protein FliF